MLRRFGKLIFLVLILCSGCAGSVQTNDKEEAFAALVDLDKDNNQSLELVIFEEYGEIDRDKFSMVGIKINSKDRIMFNFDYGLRLFYFSEVTNGWIEVQDKAIDTSLKPLIREHKDNFAIEDSTVFLPELPPDINASELRVYIEGKIMKNGEPTEETVSAFIDMPIARYADG